MEILTHPNEILRQKSEAVPKVDDELRVFAQDLYQVMLDAEGLGISAPQVGRLIKLIIIKKDGKPLYMFNPVVLARSSEKLEDLEGCLSFPGESVRVTRPKEIKVKYRDINNKMSYGTFHGLDARVILHEMDHLVGKLLIDYI